MIILPATAITETLLFAACARRHRDLIAYLKLDVFTILVYTCSNTLIESYRNESGRYRKKFVQYYQSQHLQLQDPINFFLLQNSGKVEFTGRVSLSINHHQII